MQIAIASDHAGYRLKCFLSAHLSEHGYTMVDFGTHSGEPVDYPDFIRPAAASIAFDECPRGIALGGSGNGEAMVANRIKGVRCAVCWNEESARLASAHNHANMIAIGARLVEQEKAAEIVDVWLDTEFDAGRHARRISKIDNFQ